MINKTNQVIDKAADQAVDSIFGTGQPKTNTNKPATQTNDSKQTTTTKPATTNTNTTTTPASNTATSATTTQPAFQVNSKYDFIAGEKVIFFDDFSTSSLDRKKWNAPVFYFIKIQVVQASDDDSFYQSDIV